LSNYEEFLSTHVDHGAKLGKGFKRDLLITQEAQQGKVMGETQQVALGKFYLCCAMQFRPLELEKAGDDSNALMRVARDCAENDVEPLIERALQLCKDYDMALHKALEETSPFYEVDEGLFWLSNFDVAAPAEFQHYLTALGHGSGQGFQPTAGHSSPRRVDEQVKAAEEILNNDTAMGEPARRAASLVYRKWLEQSSMPVKADILKALTEHGFVVGLDLHDGALLPRPLQEGFHAEARLSDFQVPQPNPCAEGRHFGA
jgi:hypothetical protein